MPPVFCMVNLLTLLLVLVGAFVLFAVLGFAFKALKWLISIGIVVIVILLILSLIGIVPL
jgi:hypothetical protein